MSKLYSIYKNEKSNLENQDTILLFESGVFYIALDKDAYALSSHFGFKLTDLNNEIKKCGFPISASDKYMNSINSIFPTKILNTKKYTSYSISNYKLDEEVVDLLQNIVEIDINNISILETYKKLEEIKRKAKNILNSENGK